MISGFERFSAFKSSYAQPLATFKAMDVICLQVQSKNRPVAISPICFLLSFNNICFILSFFFPTFQKEQG